jgi:PAS domain S-box-containing protein
MNNDVDNNWPYHSGEMAGRIRDHNWENTLLGPIPAWPQSLKTTVELMLAMKNPVCIGWGEELYLLYNDAYTRLLGGGHPAALGQPFSINDETAPLVAAIRAGDAAFSSSHPINTLYKSEKWYDDTWTPLRNDRGELNGFFSSTAEKTESVKTEQAYQNQTAELRAMLESISDAVYIGNTEGITMANQAALDQLGFTTFEELNRNISTLATEIQTRDAQTSELIPPEQQAFARAFGGERAVQEVLVRHRLSGEERVVRCAAAPVMLNGRVIAAVAVNTDVTERRQTETALRDSREQQAFLLKLSDILRPLASPAAIQETVTRAAMEYFKSDRCYYCELANGQAVIRGDATNGALPSVAGTYDLDTMPIFKAVVNYGRPFIVENVYNADLLDEGLRKMCIGLQSISFMNIPVVKDGTAAGILCVAQGEPRAWLPAEAKLAERVAERTWAAVERARSEKELQESEHRFRFLLNAVPQQVWTATPDGALNYVNEVVSTDFGYDQQEIVGHGWQKFIHPDDLAVCMEKWIASLASGRGYLAEFRLHFNDGQYYWHLARAVPMIEEGKASLWVGTNTNIEQQKNNEQKKDEFLSIASHELKTPLTSIKAFNQILQKASVAEKFRPFIIRSADHILRLERLINDLLDVTKINAGKMVYDMEPFDFSAAMQEIVESNRHLATRHEIQFLDEAKVSYTGDRFRLEQVVNNFISNAIKYSPQGKTIMVASRLELDNIVVSVQDFGIGIAPENLDKLFERYYRVDNTAMRFEGLGLGLFISSEILKRHKGSFWIESVRGEGSTFFFRLPLPEIAKKPAIESTGVYYKDSVITITYNKVKHRLDVDWTGYQNLESVQHGCMLMLDMMKKHHVTKIVNDNTHVLGSWSEAVEWTGNTWFPLMEKAGLKYFALIYSPSVFSQLSAKTSIDVGIGSITAQYFTDLSLAEQWADSL